MGPCASLRLTLLSLLTCIPPASSLCSHGRCFLTTACFQKLWYSRIRTHLHAFCAAGQTSSPLYRQGQGWDFAWKGFPGPRKENSPCSPERLSSQLCLCPQWQVLNKTKIHIQELEQTLDNLLKLKGKSALPREKASSGFPSKAEPVFHNIGRLLLGATVYHNCPPSLGICTLATWARVPRLCGFDEFPNMTLLKAP